jgi:hypothetical protein
MENSQAYCVEYKPSLAEKIWRKLGFRSHLGEYEPDEPWTGWMRSESGLNFDWRDRIRILISGRLNVHLTYHFDTPSPDKIHTRLDWEILPPGSCDR